MCNNLQGIFVTHVDTGILIKHIELGCDTVVKQHVYNIKHFPCNTNTINLQFNSIAIKMHIYKLLYTPKYPSQLYHSRCRAYSY